MFQKRAYDESMLKQMVSSEKLELIEDKARYDGTKDNPPPDQTTPTEEKTGTPAEDMRARAKEDAENELSNQESIRYGLTKGCEDRIEQIKEMTPFNDGPLDDIKRFVLPGLLIAACIFLLGGISWFTTSRLPGPGEGPKLQSPKSHTMILIDQTDRLSERCIIQLEELLATMPKTIKKCEMLSIFTIHSNSDIITPLLSVYNPGLGANEWIENLKMKRDAFIKDFMAPIVDFSKNMTKRPTSPSSPIVETVNRTMRWDKFSAKTEHRKLIVYSDMLQNSINCSDYPDSPLVYKGSPGCPNLKSMNNIEVDIRYIIRPKCYQLQTQLHQQQWVEIFRESGATVSLERVI